MFLITPILTFFASILGKFFTDKLVSFAANKVLFYGLLTITLPIVMQNFVVWLFGVLTDVVKATINECSSGVETLGQFTIIFTGLAAFLADSLMLADCIAMIVCGVAIRFILNFIPFIK